LKIRRGAIVDNIIINLYAKFMIGLWNGKFYYFENLRTTTTPTARTRTRRLITNQHAIAATRYDSDPHTRVHRVFTDMEHPHRCWPRDWTRDQCITVAQLRTGHSPLLAAYLHRIGRRDSAICPHCNGADETAEHLVLHCPAHDQAWRESWPNLHYESDPRRLWSFLEKIGAVTRPPAREWERERERERTRTTFVAIGDPLVINENTITVIILLRQQWHKVSPSSQNR